MDAAERALLETAVRDAIDGAETTAELEDAFAVLGWLEMLDAEPSDAIEIVFTTLGATNGAAAILDDVVISALGSQPRPDLAVLFPRFADWVPPGSAEEGRARAVGLASARAATAVDLLVVCDTGPELRAVTVPVATTRVQGVNGIDPGAGLRAVRAELDDAGGTPLDAVAWEAAVAAGRRAVAYQIAGASRAMLALARAHALERVQFERPIARFQAVRHRLAEALVAVEALDAALVAAADAPGPSTAALAKAIAGRTARTVAAHCQQVLAGIGFTTDHPFHRFMRRTMVLEGIFGSADEIVVEVGRQLLANRHVPTLVEC
ncbi:MAG: acyl-CoA dehydrogenase family protein [Acidimicrobiia bacterium]